MGSDGKQIAFQRPARIEIRQARKKPNQRLLDDVFRCVAPFQPAFDKGQEPPFVARNQLVPRRFISGANLLDQQYLGRHSLPYCEKTPKTKFGPTSQFYLSGRRISALSRGRS